MHIYLIKYLKNFNWFQYQNKFTKSLLKLEKKFISLQLRKHSGQEIYLKEKPLTQPQNHRYQAKLEILVVFVLSEALVSGRRAVASQPPPVGFLSYRAASVDRIILLHLAEFSTTFQKNCHDKSSYEIVTQFYKSSVNFQS